MKQQVISAVIFLLLATAIINAQSPYIHKVFDYRPAPGQFINELPEYEAGDTREDMIRKVEEAIVGDTKGLVSLGAYGGYVTFGFDHPIVNVPDAYDFKIWGNAFVNSNGGGNCEPGIVMVSYDANTNGLPDDEWYELAGSEYTKPETIKNYQLTYYKPDENKEPTPDPDFPFMNDTSYIKWTDNQEIEGYISRNTFHSQPYYPQWIGEETLFFEGTKLADNYMLESETGNYVQYAYPWGYADNYPNTDDRSGFNIEWAVDSNGNLIHLPAVHFVKVYTGVNQYCGWLGETSTEITGAEDLHPDAVGINHLYQDKNTIRLLKNPVDDVLTVELSEPQILHIYNALGQLIRTKYASEGINQIDCSHLQKGVYIIVSNLEKIKFIKQ